jgi:hypothetical protein
MTSCGHSWETQVPSVLLVLEGPRAYSPEGDRDVGPLTPSRPWLGRVIANIY